MKIKTYIALYILAFSTTAIQAQHIYANTTPVKDVTPSINSLFIINYNMGVATGSIKEFTQKNSYRGTSIEYRAFLSNKLSLGFSGDFQNFYDAKGKETIDYNDIVLTGNAYNWVYTSSLLGTVHYHITNPATSKVVPYLGIGAGGVYTSYEKTIGGVDFQGDDWQFGIAPEAGFLLKLNRHLFLNASARYNYTFGNDNMNSQKYWTIKTGFAFAF
ncbi:outer membrane beta-barrel protein [Prolixibacteraceae bacterium]|nr:outer membrane beta-barrel protein [Prolixibacteraceae bacterium]